MIIIIVNIIVKRVCFGCLCWLFFVVMIVEIRYIEDKFNEVIKMCSFMFLGFKWNKRYNNKVNNKECVIISRYKLFLIGFWY